jgi:hypothetical protein
MRLRAASMRGFAAVSIVAAITLFAAVRIEFAATQDAAPASAAKQPPPASAYAGDSACQSCHKESATYALTAHQHTSRPADLKTIKGSFVAPNNQLMTANPNLGFFMTSNADGIFESALDVTNPDHPHMQTEPIDIVVGSGRKGQTYLYWKDDLLFELPVSYWTETKGWINSPGYRDGYADFDRPIVPRCLDCHGSYFTSLEPPVNRFRKDSIVLGIRCEKCHGPGLEHVRREHSAKPPAHGSPELAIINPAHLPRERQLDLCSNCHAGAATPIAPVLSFQPGDKIDEFLTIPDPGPNVPVDVHGNQVVLLRRSRCFQSSQMTCSTCHDVHRQQRDLAAYSKDCLGCHKIEACPKYATQHEAIRPKCVVCHMPLQSSQVLFSDNTGKHLEPLVRNHQIAIYPEVKASN